MTIIIMIIMILIILIITMILTTITQLLCIVTMLVIIIIMIVTLIILLMLMIVKLLIVVRITIIMFIVVVIIIIINIIIISIIIRSTAWLFIAGDVLFGAVYFPWLSSNLQHYVWLPYAFPTLSCFLQYSWFCWYYSMFPALECLWRSCTLYPMMFKYVRKKSPRRIIIMLILTINIDIIPT